MSVVTTYLTDTYTWSRTVVPSKYRNRWFVFIIVAFGLALDNFSLVSGLVVTDSVQAHFGTSYAIASWTVSGYSLTLGSFIILFGKLADVLGPDNVFIFGVTLFWITALIASAVESVIVVIVFRTIQGIAGAALVPAAFALAGNYFYADPKELQIALGVVFLSLNATMGTGALIGGAFAQTSIGYKGLYYFTFGSSFVISILSIFLVNPIPQTEEHKKMKVKNIDFIGMFLFIVGALLIILGLTEGGDNWKTPKAYVPLPVGFVMVVISIIWELVYITRFKKKYEEDNKDLDSTASSIDQGQFDGEKEIETVPVKKDWRVNMDLMFPLEALSAPDYILFTIGSVLYYMSFTFVLSLSIQYHIYVSQDIPIISGLKALPYAVGIALVGLLVSEEIMYKVGPRVMLVGGSVAIVGAYALLTREVYTIENAYWKFGFPGMLLYGCANSLYFKYFFVKIFPVIPTNFQGIASGIYQAFAQIGLSVGNALIASVVGKIMVAETPELRHEFSQRFVTVRYIGFGIVGSIFIVTLFMGWGKTADQVVSEQNDETIESRKEEDGSSD